MNKGQTKIELIKLPNGLLEKEVRVCCLQLKSPFWDEVNDNEKGSKQFICWKPGALQKRKTRIVKILQELETNFLNNGQKINIIVFPEYAFGLEGDMIKPIEAFSLKHKIILVIGHYDINQRQSIAEILIPDTEKEEVRYYSQYKLSSSIYDEGFLSELDKEKKLFYKFVWQPDNDINEINFIQVFVCHDFLDSACQSIDPNMPGLIIVPMCSPRIEEFHGLSYHFARSTEGYQSSVVALCNATDISPPQKVTNMQKMEKLACGFSQLIGPYRGLLPQIGRFMEGGYIAKINLNTVLQQLTRTKRENVISNVIKFFLEDNKIKDSNISRDILYKYMVNPNALLLPLGLRKIYAFYSLKNYSMFIKNIANLPYQCHGVFGIYDILCLGWEEEWDGFDRRIVSYLGDKYRELRDPDLPTPKYHVVTHVLKTRSKQLMDIKDGKFVSKYGFEFEANYIENNLKEIRNIALGHEINADKKKELEDQGIIVEVRSNSDIFPHEEEMRLEEYLVFLFLYPSGEKSMNLVMKEFQKTILPNLMIEDKIRTIEFCGKQHYEGDFPEGEFIFHIVGGLDDVRHICLKNIHEVAYDNEIRTRTFVVPTAKLLSKEKYISLGETILRNPQLRKTVYEIAYYMKFVDPSNPFIIKYLPRDIIEEVGSFYVKYKNYIGNYMNKTEAESRGEFLSKLNQYIYGFCNGFLTEGYLNEEIYTTIKGRCKGSFDFLSEQIEKHLKEKRQEILFLIKSKLSDEVNNKYEKKLRKIKISKNKDVYSVLIDESQTIMGDLQKSIIKWNEKVDIYHVIGEKQFTIALKELDIVVTYRNYFSHSFKRKMEQQTTTEFTYNMLKATVMAFNLIQSHIVL